MAASRHALDALRGPRRSELAFLHSTPAYRRQLVYFGIGEVDEVMNRVVPQGTYAEMPAILTEWYSGLCTGLSLPVPDDDEHLTTLVERCKAIPTSREPVPS